MTALGPRLVIAGTNSGVGKTTVATGLLAALRNRGLPVASAKVGPDFIDPGYHALATGRPGRNLDAWMCGPDVIPPLAAQAAHDAEILVIEGVMGLFDGAADDGTGSTAHIARLLDAPIVLVVDASAMSGSVAALVHGFATFDPSLRIAGVVLNRVGSDGHEVMLREALAPLSVPVLGALRRDDAFAWRDRHLGLVPVVEHPNEVRAALDRLAVAIERWCDVDELDALARAAPAHPVNSPLPFARRAATAPARIALASGPAFSFVYPDSLELLEQAGGELVPFDPTADTALPTGVDALYAGGGFPEVFVDALAANRPLLDDVAHRVQSGLVVWAECGGLLWLARSLDGRALAGVVPADGHMSDRLTLGYRRATTRTVCPVGPAGTELRGHEFHYSTLDPPGDALAMTGRFGSGCAGFASGSLLASYLHVHLAAAPAWAEHFVATAASAAGRRRDRPR